MNRIEFLMTSLGIALLLTANPAAGQSVQADADPTGARFVGPDTTSQTLSDRSRIRVHRHVFPSKVYVPPKAEDPPERPEYSDVRSYTPRYRRSYYRTRGSYRRNYRHRGLKRGHHRHHKPYGIYLRYRK